MDHILRLLINFQSGMSLQLTPGTLDGQEGDGEGRRGPVKEPDEKGDDWTWCGVPNWPRIWAAISRSPAAPRPRIDSGHSQNNNNEQRWGEAGAPLWKLEGACHYLEVNNSWGCGESGWRCTKDTQRVAFTHFDVQYVVRHTVNKYQGKVMSG